MLDFTKKEKDLIKKLDTPAKVQDFLNSLKFNFEKEGETFKSPIRVLRTGSAHCIEGATLGAYILSRHGHEPLLLHLKTTKYDQDHVIALFKINDLWGALSKTNHAVLRYREPVYKTVRELVMSYFNEYYLANGDKTLREYSQPLNLNIFEDSWPTEELDLWGIDEELDDIKHYDIAPKQFFDNLRKASKLERKIVGIEEYREN